MPVPEAAMRPALRGDVLLGVAASRHAWAM